MELRLEIRSALPKDLDHVLTVHREAFKSNDEPELTRTLLADPGARPLISLVATADGLVVGHILLTRASVEGHEDVAASMLAPLGVVPERQNHGIGSMLTREAISAATKQHIQLIFLAGHPGFYPRFGFRTNAADLGFDPPAPMPPGHAPAWMVNELVPGTISGLSGRVIAANELMKPKYWTE
jgi:putative acetyltransferase